MSAYIPDEIRIQIIERANGRCEYCQIHQDDTPFSHQIDHIIARQHGGDNNLSNLALACLDCNKYKGPNLSSIDPMSGEVTVLFHPRNNEWDEHFKLKGPIIEALSATGRTTAFLLRLNAPLRIIQRETLLSVGRYGRDE